MDFKKNDPTPKPTAADITVSFHDLGLHDHVEVYDIWQQEYLGTFERRFTQSVPPHGTAFLRLKPKFP